MPLNPPPQITHYPSGLSQDQIDDLEAKFSDWQTLVNISCVATAFLFFLGTHLLLTYASRSFANSDGLSGLHILYQQAIWWFFPGLGAFTLSFEIVLQVWSIFTSRWIVNLYVEWAARQPKRYRGDDVYYDSRTLYRWITLFIALPVGIATALALNMHTTFADDGMHEYGYAFASPKFYSYSQIREVIQVEGVLGKHNAFIPGPYDVIDFTDGYRWSQHNWDDSTHGVTDALDATLTTHTNLSFLHAHFL